MAFGVPNPYDTHVHPWPTRFHGGIWTRPVFGYPWQQSVQSVFKPSDLNDGNPGLHGLGELLWQTNRGVFGAPRNGGGVFGPQAGLGDDYSLPAFVNTTELVRDATTAAPPAQPTVPGLKKDDSRVRELQAYLNRVLKAAGYQELGSPDGALGGKTCGAIAWYKATGRGLAAGTTAQAAIDANLAVMATTYQGVCAGKTLSAPVKVGAGGGGGSVAPYVPPVGPVVPPPVEYQAGMSASTKYAIGGGVLAVVGFFVAKKAKWI